MTGKKVGLYARVSTHDQHTLPLQLKDLRRYAKQRGWRVVMQIQDVGSGVKERPKREALLKAARRREVDTVLVWRLDRWGRSVEDLVGTLRELQEELLSGSGNILNLLEKRKIYILRVIFKDLKKILSVICYRDFSWEKRLSLKKSRLSKTLTAVAAGSRGGVCVV